ncbi:MAG: glycosyltransferase family 9 protein [Bacteroidota bacterium]
MKSDNRKTYEIVPWGGLGDELMLTPILKGIKLREPKSRIILYLFRDEIFRHNPNVDKIKFLDIYKNPISAIRFRFWPNSFHFLAYGFSKPSLFYQNLHATEIIGKMIGIELVDKQVQIYITDEENNKALQFLSHYNNPILIQITSQASNNQNWLINKWEELIRRMPNYTFLQLGINGEIKVKGAIDLLGKTTIRESMALLKNVQSFVGVDSFLNNASNAFFTRGVVLFGPSPPQVWGHPNNINLYKKTACSPCIDLLGPNPCPYNIKCMQQITVDEVHEALKIQLALKENT